MRALGLGRGTCIHYLYEQTSTSICVQDRSKRLVIVLDDLEFKINSGHQKSDHNCDSRNHGCFTAYGLNDRKRTINGHKRTNDVVLPSLDTFVTPDDVDNNRKVARTAIHA
jgi:hypothetical protein